MELLLLYRRLYICFDTMGTSEDIKVLAINVYCCLYQCNGGFRD